MTRILIAAAGLAALAACQPPSPVGNDAAANLAASHEAMANAIEAQAENMTAPIDEAEFANMAAAPGNAAE
jgi:hypothetical protein